MKLSMKFSSELPGNKIEKGKKVRLHTSHYLMKESMQIHRGMLAWQMSNGGYFQELNLNRDI